jgi:hypothetical protein
MLEGGPGVRGRGQPGSLSLGYNQSEMEYTLIVGSSPTLKSLGVTALVYCKGCGENDFEDMNLFLLICASTI